MTGAKHDHNSPRGAHSTPAVPSIPLSEDSAARVRAGSADGSGSGNGKVAADASIGSLIKDASAHVSTLVRAEVELARSEVVAEVKKGVKGSVFFIVALTILLFSLFYFFFAIAELLADIGLYRSAAFGIVFGFMLVLAGL
ncbi:MAG: phage holin family protein, partial [Sciscionella sp.]|nr:phage holin family protein [Sciscionella sp.]